MDANPEDRTPKDPRLEAFWDRVSEIGQANMLLAGAELGGRLEAAARPTASNVIAPETAANDSVACLSNTPPQSSAGPLVTLNGFPEYSVACDIDWLEWSASFDMEPSIHTQFVTQLQQVKDACQELGEPERWLPLPGIGPIRVARMGFTRAGGRGPHYDFKICFHGIWIGIAKRRGRDSKQPNLFVMQTGRDCLLRGAWQTHQQVQSFVRALGGTIVWEKLSRIDLCLDILGLPIPTFKPFITERRFITRAKSVEPRENAVKGRWTGVVVGKHPLRIVFYDKIEEQKQSHDALYRTTLETRRWAGQSPQHVSRIELQLGREWLRNHGINSPQDFYDHTGTIISTILGDWFRLTTKPVVSKKKDQARIETDPFWTAIAEAFVGWFGLPDGPLPEVPRSKVNPILAIRQAVGCLSGALQQQGYLLTVFDDLVELFKISLSLAFPSHEQRVAFLKEYQRRMVEYRT